jgi:hypothetical protein
LYKESSQAHDKKGQKGFKMVSRWRISTLLSRAAIDAIARIRLRVWRRSLKWKA